MTGILIGIMLIESILDIKTKQVWIVPPILLMVTGVVWDLIQEKRGVGEIVGMTIIVLLLVLISKGSKEALGMGDVWLIGSILGVQGMLVGIESVVLAFLLSGIYGGIQLVRYKSGKRRFPMAPFLLVGTIGGVYMA